MKCPNCDAKMNVVDNSHTPDNETYRKYRCLKCGHCIYTLEFEVEWTPQVQHEYWKYNRIYKNIKTN